MSLLELAYSVFKNRKEKKIAHISPLPGTITYL